MRWRWQALCRCLPGCFLYTVISEGFTHLHVQVYMAMTGASFMQSGNEVVSLLKRNAMNAYGVWWGTSGHALMGAVTLCFHCLFVPFSNVCFPCLANSDLLFVQVASSHSAPLHQLNPLHMLWICSVHHPGWPFQPQSFWLLWAVWSGGEYGCQILGSLKW
jgi:hypothetical protein